MAVATEHGLFIDGEVVEPASGEVRDLCEPATGELLARAAMGGEADVDRAVVAARAALERRLGQDPGHRALPPPARARRRGHGEPQGARRARVAQRRQGDLVGQGRDRGRRRVLPLLRLRDRDHRGTLESHRRLAALLFAEGAGRRRRADRALELSAVDVDVEARARARCRVFGRAQAGSSDTAERAAHRGARGGGRLPGRRDQHRARVTARRPAPISSSIPASTRSRSRARRGRAARSCGSAPTRSSA